VKVTGIGIAYGDSGGPVFARAVSGGPYYALGIVAAGTMSIGGGLPAASCLEGSLCKMWFTRWNNLESDLGLGSLNPKTVLQ
jgi:hypothetical protein